MVRQLGADHVFDYTQEDYTESGKQYDVIIDNVGNRSLRANKRVLKPDGIFVIVGAEKGDWIRPLMRPINAMLFSAFVEREFGMMLARLTEEDPTRLADLMQAGTVTPVIDRRYPMSEIAAAMRYSEADHARGKIIVNIE